MKDKLTIQEIANLSGVSVSTVSRVLNDSPSVSDDKRSRVKDIIEKYNYTPSVFARGLVNNKTKNIGIILPDISNPYFASLFTQIQKFALDHNYSTILFNTMFAGPQKDKLKANLTEEYYLKIILEKQVDGLLILGGEVDKEIISKDYLIALNKLNNLIPVVIIGSKIDECSCIFVERDLNQGVTTLVTHLTALGHSKIGFLGGELGIKITTARINSFKNSMKSLGNNIDDNWIITSDYYAPSGYDAAKKLLDNSKGNYPTALVCINDSVAIGVIRALNDYGLKCPDDIAIVSCDQFFYSDYQTPRITSLDQHNEYLGKVAMLQLINAINGNTEPIQINHSPKLIIRESCGMNI